jgi:Tol biopolymer transport system component
MVVAVQVGAAAGFGTANGKIMFGGSRGVYVMNADGTGKRLLIGARYASPVWSPDGQRIAYTVDQPGPDDLYVGNVRGTVRWRVMRNVGADVSWSPDSRTLAISRQAAHGEDAPSDIWSVGIDGRNQRRLTLTPSDEGAPLWSPGGENIAFHSGWDIYVMRADGSGRSKLVDGDSYASFAWSPDGRMLVFESDWPDYEIHAVSTDGTGPRRLTSSPSNVHDEIGSQAWSPDGRTIVFQRGPWPEDVDDTGGRWSIRTARSDGTAQQRLVWDAYDPAWSPDGRKIAYTTDTGVFVMNADGSARKRLARAAADDPSWQPASP